MHTARSLLYRWICVGGLCPGGLCAGGLCLGGVDDRDPLPSLVRQTPVKTLPCPKRRLRMVKIMATEDSRIDFMFLTLLRLSHSIHHWHTT